MIYREVLFKNWKILMHENIISGRTLKTWSSREISWNFIWKSIVLNTTIDLFVEKD